MPGATAFPGALDSFTNANATDLTSAVVTHSTRHGNVEKAIVAIETWLDAAPVHVVSVAGTAQTLPDPRINPINVLTLTSASCALTFPAAAAGKSLTTVLVQDATGGRLVTFPASVKWNAGTAPTLTATAAGIDVLTHLCVDGANWLSFVAGQGMA